MANIGGSVSSPITFGWIDHSGEPSRTRLHLPAVVNSNTAGNVEDLFTDVTGAYDLVKAAMVLLTKLNHTQTTLGVKIDQSVESLPAAKDAQREWACRVSYVDNVTGKKYRFDIPAPADSIIPSGTDEVDLADVEFAAFKTVIEAQCVSELGNAITIVGARIVGRNN